MRLAIANLATKGYSGGYAKYLEEVIPRLLTSDQIDDLGIFSLQTRRVRGVDIGGRTVAIADSRRLLANAISLWDADVVFIPAATLLHDIQIPQVVMLRNMEPYDFPLRMNPACEALRNCVRRLGGYWACKRAAGVIAVSNYAGVLLRDKWGLPSYRIEVIYHGGTGLHECRPANRSDSIPSPVVFAAGSIRPARGLEDAVRAIALLLERGYGLGLTIAGGIDPGMTGYVRRLKRLSRDLGIESKISWRGRIGKCEMDALYRSSAAFVMTSRTEACPNIALEAMTAGSLSIGTDIPPIREIFGDTALYYSPGNVSELVDQICATVEFPAEERETRRRRAQERAAGFRWEETAQRTARFLTEVARGKRIG